MTLSEEKNGKVFILGLRGKVEAEGTKRFVQRMTEILDGGERYILLDLTDVAYINSSGVHALVLVANQVASSGGKLILAGVSDSIQKVLKISGLTSSFTLQPTKAEALGSFPQ
ncbi:MAG: STAS domain-containing protein [Terriglobia bacterium]|jgi:anti-anti-sigma factor